MAIGRTVKKIGIIVQESVATAQGWVDAFRTSATGTTVLKYAVLKIGKVA